MLKIPIGSIFSDPLTVTIKRSDPINSDPLETNNIFRKLRTKTQNHFNFRSAFQTITLYFKQFKPPIGLLNTYF